MELLEDPEVGVVKIRTLPYDEVHRLNPIARKFGRESRLVDQFDLPVDTKFFADQIRTLMDVGMAETIVAERGDRIIGVLGFNVTPHLFTGVLIASEFMWYVLPEERGGSIAVRLFKDYERRAKQMGCKLISMIHLKNSMPSRLRKFYEGQGYHESETVYLKRHYGTLH